MQYNLLQDAGGVKVIIVEDEQGNFSLTFMGYLMSELSLKRNSRDDI